MRQKKSRVRVTRNAIEAQKKKAKYVSPGPWTNLDTKLSIQAKLKRNKPISSIFGEYILGVYRPEDENLLEPTKPISFNIVVDNLKELVSKHGIDQVLAACEKSLNSYLYKGKKLFGDIVITHLVSDNSQRENEQDRFLSVLGKTTKKEIKLFLGEGRIDGVNTLVVY
jgi:hypothetical protein